MRWPLPPRISLGFAAALLTVIVGAATSYEALAVRRANVAAVTHTFATLDALEQLLGVLRDAETGQRGYLLTGDEWYLGPYRAARESVEDVLATARRRVEADPEQRRRLAELEPVLRRKLAEVQETIETRRAGRTARSVAMLRSNEGASLMQELRDRIAEMQRIERAELEQRQAIWTRSIFGSNVIFAAAIVLLLVVIVLAAHMVRRELREREARERERARLIELQHQLMAIVGHDLRNPLSAVITSTQILARPPDLSPASRRTLERITHSARRMERLIRDLLDFSRARVEGGVPIAPRPADLRAICRRVADELEPENPGRVIECTHRGEATGTWDPDRLEQVISNLVANALRYSSPQSSVQISTEGGGDRVAVAVHNEGAPIAPELLPHLFEPFKRGDHPGNGVPSHSVGLGLYIVRTVVEAHGGQVQVRSRENEGTTFRFELPRHAGGEPRVEEPQIEARQAP